MKVLVIYNSSDMGLKIAKVEMTDAEYARFSTINNRYMNTEFLSEEESVTISILDSALTLSNEDAIDYGHPEGSDEASYFGKWATEWSADVESNVASDVDATIIFGWY
jgi:hypothetical protein